MIRFDRYLSEMLDAAGREAGAEGSSTIEAHHLLLAIAGSEEPTTQRLLASVGLDQAAIRAALSREVEQSLAAVGVSVGPTGMPRPRHPRQATPPLGASVKLAIERGVGSAGGKERPQPGHLLLGIMLAPVGTVPRALALVGVDRDALIGAMRHTIGIDGRISVPSTGGSR